MSSVGEILKNTREAKGITLEQVAEATSIRVLYLQAIENEQFSLIPGEVYLKGFIRNYANFIGLNGPAMVEKYKEQAAAAKKSNYSMSETELIDEKKETIVRRRPKKPAFNMAFIQELLNKFLNKNNIFIIVVVVFVFAIGNFLFHLINDNKVNDYSKPNTIESIQKDAAKVQSEIVVAKDSSGIFVVKNAQKIETNVEFSGECWVEAYADGKEAFVGMMSLGKTATWTAEKELQIKFGNIRAVKITCNDQLIPIDSAEHGVVVRTFRR